MYSEGVADDMATIQRSNTKVANKLINYAEKRAEVLEGVNCPAEYAKSQMKATRELWGKTGGIQAHHVIQSFKPGEVTPERANEIGQELAKEVAKGHEAVVYTHADKNHIHNHIVINSVNYEDGSKYHASKESLYQIREANDRLCKERGLSVVEGKDSPIRYTLAEKGLLDKGETSWKEEIRKVIDHEKTQAKTYDEFKHNLKENYGVDVLERGKNITFTHPDNSKKVRGSKLGNDYEKETIKNGFERQIERKTEPSQERGNTEISSSAGYETRRAEATYEGDHRAERSHEKLHQSSHGQRWYKPDDDRPRTLENQKNQPGSSGQDDFDFNKARQHAERLRQSTVESYGKWQERDVSQQSADTPKDERNRGNVEQEHERNDQQNERKHGRPREQSHEIDFDR